jgi:hypothetical protein
MNWASNRRFRTISAPLAAVLLLVAWRAASAEVKLDLSAGFDNLYRAGTWTPLVVRVSGSPSNTPAQLQVQVRSKFGGTSTYLQTVNLHSGGVDQFVTCYEHPSVGDNADIVAQLIIGGRSAAEKKLDGSAALPDGQPVVLGLTQDQSGLNFLGQVDVGIQHRNSASANNPNGNPYQTNNPFQNPGGIAAPRNPTRVLYPRVSTLPSSPFAYRAIDAIVLGDIPLDSFNEDQWNAITAWVSDGGILVVSGGADVNRARNTLLAPLLPIRVNGARQVRSLPSLGDVYGTAPNLTTAGVLTGSLAPDATALCSDGGQPTIALRRYGLGTVVMTSFDLLAPELRAWQGQPRLWQDIMERGTRTYAVTRRMQDAMEPERFQPWNNQGYSSRTLTDALAGVQSVEAPPFQMIGLFLLAYIIFLVPVNYLLLKRWDRKELAWITAPAIILLFSVGAYAQGYRIKGGQLYLRSCSVIEGASGGKTYNAYTFASIFSPRQGRYTLSVADTNAAAADIVEGNGYQGSPSDIQIVRDQRTSVKDALVNMWDHRSFGITSHVDLGGEISASVEQPNSRTGRIHVANGTKYTLNDCAVSFRGNQALVGDLKPGQAKMVSLALDGNSANAVSLIAGGSAGGQKNEAAIKNALSGILSDFQTMDPATGQNAGPLVLSGWFNDDVTGVRLENEAPKTANVNLLVIHLPTPGGYEVAPRPVVGAPMSGSGGGPGMIPRGPTFPAQPVPVQPPIRPQTADGYNNLAYTYANQGKLDLALNAARTALRMAPQDGNILDSVAEMHQRRKEYRQAATYYALALSRQPNGGITETHEKYGETLIALGDKVNGIRHLQTAARDSRSPYGARALQQLQKQGAPTTPSGSGTSF